METKRRTPIKAIREHCLQCSGGSSNEVKLCQIPTCPLYIYRIGKNPAMAGRKGPVFYQKAQGNVA